MLGDRYASAKAGRGWLPHHTRAELKHSGVHQLVAKKVNPAGRVEREVKLSVEAESVRADDVSAYDTVPMGDAIPVAMFGDHMEQRHARSNKPFKDEYDVRLVL